MAETIGHSPIYEIDRVPVPLAEELDHALVTAAMKKYETKQNPIGWLHSAWNFAEYAMNVKDMDLDDKEEYFRVTQYLTAMSMRHPEVHQDTTLSALTLLTYLPLLRKRGREAEIQPQDCTDVYQSLAMAMRYMRPLTIDEPPQWRMMEIGVLCLSARSQQPQLLLYPASPREESSELPEFNHDSYFLDQAGKIPLQQKLLPTQKTYDEIVRILTLQPMIDRAAKKTRASTGENLAEKVNYVLSLIIAETTNQNLTKTELNFLNTMTEAVVSHSFAHSEQETMAA